ncbi:MAG: TetR family transcriptional regulator [Ignavibacteria bacterium]|nr:TetR family transcriptional regulator [Ignavibacteria bacterium]
MISSRSHISAKQSKRELILEIAAPLFSAHDFHEVNMELVAKNAEIAKGTIYNYFKSKEELYFAIIETRLSKLISELQKKIDQQISVLEDLKGFILHVFMFMMKYQNFFLIFQRTRLKTQSTNHSEIEEKMSLLKLMLSNILTEGIERKVFREVDPCLTSDIILGIIYSTVQRNIGKNHHDDLIEAERNYLFDFIKDGILTPYIIEKQLDGKTILLTRTLSQSDESSLLFTSAGAKVIVLPTLKIVPPSSWKKCDDAIKDILEFDSIIFSSVNAVRWFLKRLEYHELKLDLSAYDVIAVGPKTEAECKTQGIHVSFVPKEFSSIGVINEIKGQNIIGKRFLIPHSEIGRPELVDELTKLGALPVSVPVYDVVVPEPNEIEDSISQLKVNTIDLYVFTSPSTFVNYLEIFKIKNAVEYFKNEIIAAIGPTTKKAIENYGVQVKIVPDNHTIQGLVDSVVNYFKKEN